jgi:hypothetical protein
LTTCASVSGTDFGLANNLDRARLAVLELSGGDLTALRYWIGMVGPIGHRRRRDVRGQHCRGG